MTIANCKLERILGWNCKFHPASIGTSKLLRRIYAQLGIETGWQAGNSLLYNGDLSKVDYADIGFAGIFGKSGYVAMAMFDYNSSDGFIYAFGPKKSLTEFGIDLSLGRFNKLHIDAMGSAGVGNGVINFFNYVNNPLRLTVSTGIKEGVK
jgi:hypothetical protein